ncbi:unnamed protein product [Closterium sp. Naga37s-1]|nr:unnamed protein product [Closterium sp. Naga37s-1]
MSALAILTATPPEPPLPSSPHSHSPPHPFPPFPTFLHLSPPLSEQQQATGTCSMQQARAIHMATPAAWLPALVSPSAKFFGSREGRGLNPSQIPPALPLAPPLPLYPTPPSVPVFIPHPFPQSLLPPLSEQQQARGTCSMQQARAIQMATSAAPPLLSSPHPPSPTHTSPPFPTTFRAAAGNGHVQYAAGTGYSYGNTSGMAPRARLAIYKVLWKQRDGQTLATYSDIRAAVDAAVSDGVDVLSISLGGNVPSYFSDIAYLNAAKAGVFIAMAAGNSGRPSPKKLVGTIGNASPFYLTVGASSISRTVSGSGAGGGKQCLSLRNCQHTEA